jgi:hypothetical protein
MKTITVCPAGRRRYLELLVPHLKYQHSIGAIDEHQWWLNTKNTPDIAYIEEVTLKNNWMKIIPSKMTPWGIQTIFPFYEDAIEEAVYIKIDDDVVWMDKDAIANLVNCKLKYRENSFVLANTINNPTCNFIHQKFGCLPLEIANLKLYEENKEDWYDGKVAEKIHLNFLSKYHTDQLNEYLFSIWMLDSYMSINFIAWIGSDIGDALKWPSNIWPKEFTDEQCFNTMFPLLSQRPNIICGTSLVAHFSFFKQRKHLDSTNLLEEYKKLLPGKE